MQKHKNNDNNENKTNDYFLIPSSNENNLTYLGSSGYG